MSEFDHWFRKLPADTQAILSSIWEVIPASERKSFLQMLVSLPDNTNLLRTLIKMASVQVQMTFGQKHRIVITGPANVGKSTLFNQFIQDKADASEVSPLPGTTRVNIGADAGLFSVVDTPGADAVGEVGEAEQEEALSAAANADFLIIVFDAIQGIKKTELDLFGRLLALQKPYIVVLNKIDLVKRHREQVISNAARNLNLAPEQIIPVSATQGSGMDEILSAIALSEPGMIAALGQALPQFRWQLAWKTIVSAASGSAVVALTPLPIVDFLPLVAIQATMVLGIARIYNYQITLQRAREMVVTFGLGFLGRSLFYELSKFGGVPGWMLGTAIAASTTVAMGYAAVMWFSKGERLSQESVRQITRNTTSRILAGTKKLFSRKPAGTSLRGQISEILNDAQPEEIVISEDNAKDPPAPLAAEEKQG